MTSSRHKKAPEGAEVDILITDPEKPWPIFNYY